MRYARQEKIMNMRNHRANTFGRIRIPSLRERIATNVRLAWQTPINFLYSFVYPTDRPVRVVPHDARVVGIAGAIIASVQQVLPGIVVHFIGSASLGIAGQPDIDLLIPAAGGDLRPYLPALIALFGPPHRTGKSIVEWKFRRRGYPVEVSLMDPATRQFQEQIHAFEALQASAALRREYEALKYVAHGFSVRSYQRKKMLFFNRIIGL